MSMIYSNANIILYTQCVLWTSYCHRSFRWAECLRTFIINHSVHVLLLQLYGSKPLWLYIYSSTTLKLYNSMALRLYNSGSTALWLNDSTILWVHSSTTLWFYGSMILWLYNSMALRLDRSPALGFYISMILNFYKLYAHGTYNVNPGLKIATNTVTNATSFFSLATKIVV